MAVTHEIINHTPILEGVSYIIYIAGAIAVGFIWIIKLIYGQFKKLNDKFDELGKKMDDGFKRTDEKLNSQSERLSIIETRLEERGFHDFRRNGTEVKGE